MSTGPTETPPNPSQSPPGLGLSSPVPEGQPPPPEPLRGYFRHFALIGLALTGLSYLWRGLDFSAAALLGFLVVSANLVWTKNLAESILFGQKRGKGWVLLTYSVKFGITALILFYALVRLEMDPLGILLGLTAVVVATLLMGWAGGKKDQAP
ncbi:MAG: ATP synthase subunit I [Deltaproteobacteria bacterium]|nr:ATP synthase subunit I [Deltaproteobacteria bacterium]